MIRKITNLDNHHLRDFFTNPEKLCFLIQLMYNYNFFFPAKVIYMLRDFFILRFEFYYNSFSYFFSLVVSVWRISDLSFKNIDELITFKHVGYKRDKLYFLSPFYYNIPAPKFNTRFPSRFIFLLLQHTVHDYRVWFKHGIYRFRLQKFFKITTEYNIVFKEYHSKFRDELHFENKYKPYLFKLTNMVYKHKLNDFSLLKKKSLIYLEHKKLMSFIKIRNFFNITLLFMPFMLPFPFISSFCFSERQLKFLFFILLIIKTRSLVDSIFLSNQLYVSGLRERYECSVHLLQKQLKRWLSWKTFLVFNFIKLSDLRLRVLRNIASKSFSVKIEAKVHK